MSYRWFVQEVADRAGVSHAEADRAVTETLRALGRRLADVDARAVAAQLPPSLADPFMSHALRRRPADPTSLTANADTRLVRCACRLLAESLDEQARAHLRMQPLTSLFV